MKGQFTHSLADSILSAPAEKVDVLGLSEAVAALRLPWKGKPALLSFNEVNFLPFRASDTANPSPGDSPGVRLHHVIAHWRKVIRGGVKKMVFVRDHWRGDARNGMVIKNRNIKPPKAA